MNEKHSKFYVNPQNTERQKTLRDIKIGELSLERKSVKRSPSRTSSNAQYLSKRSNKSPLFRRGKLNQSQVSSSINEGRRVRFNMSTMSDGRTEKTGNTVNNLVNGGAKAIGLM